MLDHEYVKNNYRLIAAHFSIQKELDANPKAIWEIGFVGQSKELNANGNVPKVMFKICLF